MKVVLQSANKDPLRLYRKGTTLPHFVEIQSKQDVTEHSSSVLEANLLHLNFKSYQTFNTEYLCTRIK